MAITVATEHGISHVQIETDSANLQEAIRSTSFDLSTDGMLFQDIRGLLHEQFICPCSTFL